MAGMRRIHCTSPTIYESEFAAMNGQRSLHPFGNWNQIQQYLCSWSNQGREYIDNKSTYWHPRTWPYQNRELAWTLACMLTLRSERDFRFLAYIVWFFSTYQYIVYGHFLCLTSSNRSRRCRPTQKHMSLRPSSRYHHIVPRRELESALKLSERERKEMRQ